MMDHIGITSTLNFTAKSKHQQVLGGRQSSLSNQDASLTVHPCLGCPHKVSLQKWFILFSSLASSWSSDGRGTGEQPHLSLKYCQVSVEGRMVSTSQLLWRIWTSLLCTTSRLSTDMETTVQSVREAFTPKIRSCSVRLFGRHGMARTQLTRKFCTGRSWRTIFTVVPGPPPNGVSTSTFIGEHLNVPNLFTLLAVSVYFPGPTNRHHSPLSLVSSSTLSSSMRTTALSTGLPCSSTTTPRSPPSAAARRAIKDLEGSLWQLW